MGNYLKQRLPWMILMGLCCGIFAVVFWLYHLPVEAALYPGGLCGLLLLAWFWRDWRKTTGKRKNLKLLSALPDDLCDQLADFSSPEDRAWREIIENLSQRERQTLMDMEQQRAERLDYYTTWVHQIKTPIASARLALEDEDSPLSRRMEDELRRIEQYVEMVLTYQRLENVNTDYVFRECSLDRLIKGAVRKFAGQFIRKGIRLDYQPTEQRVLTDEKWLSFVLEQLLSNALKYTPKGTVSIGMEDGCLFIRDTGIGIAPEDLPRIFEKGYTGYNGRTDRRASGLGLYLCRKICQNLGHGIRAESIPGEGTAIWLDLRRQEGHFE